MNNRLESDKNDKKKVKNQKGFTFAETLIALLILSLATTAISVGISTAIRCYDQIMFDADSTMLRSSLNEALKEKLRYTKDIAMEGALSAGGATAEDAYYAVQEFYCYKESYDDNNELEKYKSMPSQIGVNEKGQLTDGNQVMIGTGIYSDENLRIDDFILEYNLYRKLFRFSYKVHDKRNSSHEIETGDIYVHTFTIS